MDHVSSQLQRHAHAWRAYVKLAKPGILIGNGITAAGAFLLATRVHSGYVDIWLGCMMLLGIFCVMGSACVCNNYIDRFLDREMKRTQDRALVTGAIPVRNALWFAAVLQVLGLGLLSVYTNVLVVAWATLGFVVYVFLYSFLKPRTPKATLVGSIAGATPPLVGYCAVTARLDVTSLVLFAILVLWQMPHFYAITLYRLEEYRAAAVPVLPLRKGVHATKQQMVGYIVAFLAVAPVLTWLGRTGYVYLVTALVLGGLWLWMGVRGVLGGGEKARDEQRWARQMFVVSLVVITVICTLMAIDL